MIHCSSVRAAGLFFLLSTLLFACHLPPEEIIVTVDDPVAEHPPNVELHDDPAPNENNVDRPDDEPEDLDDTDKPDDLDGTDETDDLDGTDETDDLDDTDELAVLTTEPSLLYSAEFNRLSALVVAAG